MISKDKNVGISILRIWMSIEVVLQHFAFTIIEDKAKNSLAFLIIDKYRLLAVPLFVLISFLLMDIEKVADDNELARKRFCRLMIPVVFWDVIYYVIYRLFSCFVDIPWFHGFSDFIWQLIFGHCYNKSLWFHTDVIVLTLLLIAVYKITSDRNVRIVCMLLIFIAVTLQYSGVNGNLFQNVTWPDTILGCYFEKDYIVHTIGRFIEIAPLAVIGAMIRYEKVIGLIEKNRIYVGTACLLILILLFSTEVFVEPLPSWKYAGLHSIVAPIATLCLFISIPFSILPTKIADCIHSIAGYSMGVYFMHQLVMAVLSLLLPNVAFRSLKGSALVYFICLLMAWGCSKLPIRIVKQSMT